MTADASDRLTAECAKLFPEDGEEVVRGVAIVSLDGHLTKDGRSGGLGSEADARLMSFLRRSADTILVSASTAEHEHYAYPLLQTGDIGWRKDRGLSPEPRVALVSRSSHPRAEAQFDADLVRVVPERSEGRDGFAAQAVRELRASGARRIVVEGGPTIWRDLIRHRAIDEFSITISPMFVGEQEVPLAQEAGTRFRLVGTVTVDSLIFARYALDPIAHE